MKATLFKTCSKPILIILVQTIISCSDSNDNGGGEPNQGGKLCDGVSYDPSVYECKMGELIGSCKGKDYYVAYERCEGGVVVDKDGGSSSSSSVMQSSSTTQSSSGVMLSSSSAVSSSNSSSSSIGISSSSSSSIECSSIIISNSSVCQNVRIGPPSEKKCQLLINSDCCEGVAQYIEKSPYWCGNADEIYTNGVNRYYMCCIYFD